MARNLLPPRGIFVSTRMIFDRRMNRSVKLTALQLMALAWGRDDYCTPPIHWNELAELTGKSVRTLRGQLRSLQNMGNVLSVQHIDEGVITIRLAAWLFRFDAPTSGENLVGQSSVQPASAARPMPLIVERRPPQLEGAAARPTRSAFVAAKRAARQRTAAESVPPAPVLDQNTRGTPQPSRAARPAAAVCAARELTDALKAELVERGLFPALLAEVAASPLSEPELRALMAWCCVDKPSSPAAFFMGRLRAGGKAPEAYHSKPCHVCGQYGTHADTCRQRYAYDSTNRP